MDKAKSIELLNTAVGEELQAVNQYMYFHFHLDDQGYGPLSMLLKRTAIQEMGHIELLAERILFLKGDVVMQASDAVADAEDAEFRFIFTGKVQKLVRRPVLVLAQLEFVVSVTQSRHNPNPKCGSANP